MPRTLGVVVPAYRPDVEGLAAYLRDVQSALAPDVLRVELDAPESGTVDALADVPAEVGVADGRRGKGAAITHGFEALETDVLAFADADGSVPAESLADVVAPVREGRANLGVGSRRHPDAVVESHQTRGRRWLGDTFAWLARRVLDVRLHDYQCGAKAIDRETWTSVRAHLYEPGFAWDVELLAVADALGARIEEVPVVWVDHPGSTVDPVGTTLALARTLLVVRRRASLLRGRQFGGAADYRSRGPALVDRVPTNDD